MDNRLKEDRDILKDGRKKPLADTDEVQVTASLRERSMSKLIKKLEALGEGHRTVEVWEIGNARRQDWLVRQNNLLEDYDEFLEPIYTPVHDWESRLHLPIAFTVCKTYHARMLSALIGIDPPFTVKARQAANVDRAHLVQELMRYTLMSWTNDNQGIDEVVDAWLWSWVTSGVGILKCRWDRKFTRYMDVVLEERVVGSNVVQDPETGAQLEIPSTVTEEVEREVTEEVFNGPAVEHVSPEDLLIVGGDGDPQKADDVIHSSYLTAGDLWSLSDQKVFSKESVERTINSGEDLKMAEPVNHIKENKAHRAGVSGADNPVEHQRYQILERYARIDVDGSGIPSDIILWVHKDTKAILRATYLRRVMPTGLRPFFKIDFHKRHGQDYGVGLVELLYSLTKEIDAVHNMKMDFGLLSSMPFGYYRATSSMSDEKMPIEPGVLIPLDNPQADVFFPNLGNRAAFTSQEEGLIYSYIERLTSVSDISLGIVGGQGATRTATGTRALLGESSNNLDVFLRRMNRGWGRLLRYLFSTLQDKLPPGFTFRVLGDDGNAYWETIKDKAEIAGMFDFEIDANSANSNQSIRVEQASQLVQLTGNPLDIQLGIVTPSERFEALKNFLMVNGVKDWSKYLRKPQQGRLYTPIEIADAVLAGVDIPLDPTQDLQGFIAWVDGALKDEYILGQFSQQHVMRLVSKQREAQGLLQALQAQQAQTMNQQQVAINANMAQSSPAATGMAQAAPASGVGE